MLKKLVNKRRLKEYNIKKKLYDSEQKELKFNKCCGEKFINFILESNLDVLVQNDKQERISYHSVHSHPGL